VLAHFSHHLLTALPAPLLPLIRSEFDLDYTQSGLIISAFGITYGIGQLPAGWLADRIGRPVMITIGILGVALCGLIIGLSHTYIMLIIFLALMGLMGGGYHPSASPAVAASVEPKNRGSALGFHLIGGSASYFLAPLVAAGIATALGWRGPFVILAILASIFSIIFYLVIRRRHLSTEQQLEQTGSITDKTDNQGSIRRLVAFIIIVAFAGSMAHSMISFIPLYLVDNFGIARESAGAMLSIVHSAGLWAGPLGGYLSDRFGRLRIILIACLGLGVLTYVLNFAPFGIAIGALLLIIGMFDYIRMPSAESYIIKNTSEKHRSTILGIYFFSQMEGSGVLTPLLGYTIDQLGFYHSFTIAGVSIVAVTAICSLFLRGGRD
jgi:MFS family permease